MHAIRFPRARRRARLLALLVALLPLASLAACDDDPTDTDGGNGALTVSTTDGTTTFANANLTIPVGGTVTFDLSPSHNADFESAMIADLTFGASGTRTFTTAGTYRYRCTAHSTNFTAGMVGTIVVQ